MTSIEIGTISQLYRFPVKSLVGEECNHLAVDLRGVARDRAYAIKDIDGKLGSHKTTRRFQKIPKLFELHATIRGDDTWVVFPDGREISAEDPAVSHWLSEFVGQPVTIQREQGNSHFDDSPIHLVTSASLCWLQAKLPDSLIDPRRFRANLVISCDGSEPMETNWIGRTLSIGTCKFEIAATTERCLMPNLAQGDLPYDPAILSTIGRAANAMFGVYANVLQEGIISRGDRVSFAN